MNLRLYKIALALLTGILLALSLAFYLQVQRSRVLEMQMKQQVQRNQVLETQMRRQEYEAVLNQSEIKSLKALLGHADKSMWMLKKLLVRVGKSQVEAEYQRLSKEPPVQTPTEQLLKRDRDKQKTNREFAEEMMTKEQSAR